MMISLKKTTNINFVNAFRDYFCVGIAFFALQFVAGHLSKQEDIAGVTLHFYDLTLPLISALLVLYRKKAFPILGTFFLYALYSYSLDSLLTLSAQLLAALISQTFYLFSTGKRGAVSFGRSQLTTLRIVWLVCCNSLLFISIEHWFQSRVISEPITHLFTLQTLINLQWLMNSCLTGIPFCYLLLRSVQNPVWCVLHIRHVKTLIKSGPPILCQVLWLVLLVCMMSALIVSRQDILIFTDYSLLWLLPLMLWGVICIGHAFISPVWVAMLILLGYYINSYIPPVDYNNYLHSLVISSTIVFVFSLTIVVAGVLAVRNRKYLRRLKQLFRSEPNTGLPNFQALQMDIRKYSTECLCYIRCTELNTLEQTHGIEFRFEFVKGLSTYVRKLINGAGNIYYAPGHGIILRLNAIPDIPELYKKLNSFRFIWKDYQLGLSCGMAYTTEKNLIKNLSLAIKQLNTQSYISLMQGQPLLLSPHMPGDRIVSQAVIRHMLQKAIDRQSFELMAQPIVSTMLVVQPIVSTTGLTRYHEILIRIKMVDGKLIFPDTILPVAREAGLLPALDITVIEQTFRFIQSRQKSEPNSHFSINLTPDSLNKIDFLDNVFTLF